MNRTTLNLLIMTLLLAAACGDTGMASREGTASHEVLCTDPPATDAEVAVALYLSAWNEKDPMERACKLQRSLASDAVFIDANGTLLGRPSIMDHVDTEAAIHFEDGTRREREDPIVFRHQEALAGWLTTGSQGLVVERGEDWFEVGVDGLIARVHTFAGTGNPGRLSEQLRAWQRAWNSGGETTRANELDQATTEDVRFTDLLTDVQGRSALSAEIQRQRDTFSGELTLNDQVDVFATDDGQAVLIRQAAEIALPGAGALKVVNYVRLRDGRIERLSGFPAL